MDWENRFYPLIPGIKVQFGAVFTGANANAVREHIRWPDRLRYDNGRTLKLYVEQRDFERFPLDDLDAQLESIGVAPDHFDWTLMRERIEGKAVPAACFREREWDGNPSPALWGFGRPHPFNILFTPHQLLAGPVVDHRPQVPGTPPDWRFEPVWLCSFLEGQPHFFKFCPEWCVTGIPAFAKMDGEFFAHAGPREIPKILVEFARKNHQRPARASA